MMPSSLVDQKKKKTGLKGRLHDDALIFPGLLFGWLAG